MDTDTQPPTCIKCKKAVTPRPTPRPNPDTFVLSECCEAPVMWLR